MSLEQTIELLIDENPLSVTEIAKETFVECADCRETTPLSVHKDHIQDTLETMMDKGKITSTPDFKYRLARKA